MLSLVCSSNCPLINASSSPSVSKLKDSIFLYGFGISGLNHNPSLFKKGRRNDAMGNDSEFEVDPDKAREALRKLDEQLKSLSEKQINPPKIRAADLDQENPWSTQEPTDVSGSFLTYLASALLVFTIVYNVIFATVIKPSIDGDDQEEPVPALNVTKNTQEGASVEKSVTTPRIPVGL